MKQVLTIIGIIGGIGAILFLAIFSVIVLIDAIYNGIPLFLTMEGEGIVVNHLNRSAPQQGLWVVLDDGTDLRVAPGTLWDIIDQGDYVQKTRHSFTYSINHIAHNALWYMLAADAQVAAVLFVGLGMVFLGIYLRQRR